MFAGVVLVGLGLTGLGMSLCGGFFTVLSLIEAIEGKQGREAEAWSPVLILTGSLSLVLGLGAIVLTLVVWQRVFKRR
ncbi:MAG: hypothetical protein Q8N23_06090 [Archangium sp.]|nr:hypothetical protein [Archangium sp.]MDP3152221.1 hypothetical protein [Archangium sp.]MDP3571066.1 hypothetical protein [Archangium sp.]